MGAGIRPPAPRKTLTCFTWDDPMLKSRLSLDYSLILNRERDNTSHIAYSG
jgi:hypothetical protein